VKEFHIYKFAKSAVIVNSKMKTNGISNQKGG